MQFYDVKGKKKFSTDKYKVVTKRVRGHNRKFAVAKAPSGIQAWRVI